MATTTDPDETPRAGPEFVQSLARGLSVLEAFGQDGVPDPTLSEVARRTGLTRATARRLLHTLVGLGYVRTDGRTFALQPRALRLGYAYLSSRSLPELAQPHLEALTRAVEESSSMSVLDGDDVVYVARVMTKRIMAVAISVGTRLPAHTTSMGRVLLAHADRDWVRERLQASPPVPLTPRTTTSPAALLAELDRVLADGHSLVDQELEMGLRSVAVPVHDAEGRVVAAMNVSTPATRGTAAAVRKEVLPALRAAADAVEADLAASRPRGRRAR